MNFPELPFPSDLPSFPTHLDVSAYLQHYADKFALTRIISFRTEVVEVAPHFSPLVKGSNQEQIGEESPLSDGIGMPDAAVSWKVTSVNLETGQRTSEIFNAVFICNG